MELKLNEAAKEIHNANKEKGFWDKPREIGTLLMLINSELVEALEADREDRFADIDLYEAVGHSGDTTDEDWMRISFENNIKDTFEDEIADTVIRILDLCGAKGIDIEKHIRLKLEYNKSRDKMHGKKY